MAPRGTAVRVTVYKRRLGSQAAKLLGHAAVTVPKFDRDFNGKAIRRSTDSDSSARLAPACGTPLQARVRRHRDS